MSLLTQPSDGQVELLMQLLQVEAHSVAQLDMFEVLPATLVPRVQVGGVTRQRLHPDLAACARHELLDRRPPVYGRAIPNHQQPLSCHTQQVSQELDAVQPVERLLPHQRVDLTLE